MHNGKVLFAIRGYAFLIALLLYLVNMVQTSKEVTILLNITSIFLFISAIIRGGRFYSAMSLFLLIGSFIIIELRDFSFLEMVEGFSAMVKLILFIGIIPLVSFPVKGYVDDIKRMMIYLSHRVTPIKLCHYASFFLANVINLAAIPIAKILFFQDGPDRDKQLINAELTGRSFGLAMMCTPIGAAIAVSLDITGANWISLLSINILLVTIGLLLSYQIGKRRIKATEDIEPEIDTIRETPNYVRLSHVLIPFILYFLFLLIADGSFSLGIMELIVISVLPFTFIWSILLKNVPEWWQTFKVQLFQETPKSFGQYAVIISAGLMIYVFEVTGLDIELIQLLPWVGHVGAAYFYIPITILIVLLLSMVGVHQFVAMMFVGNLINPVIFGISQTVFSSALLVGFVVGMFASAFSGANILMGNLAGISSFEVGRKNYLFTFLFICVSTVLLIGFNSFL